MLNYVNFNVRFLSSLFLVIFVFGRLRFCRLCFWSSSFLVVFDFGRLCFWSSLFLVVFHVGRLPFWSSSILVFFHFGRLPFWSSSILVFPMRSSSLQGRLPSKVVFHQRVPPPMYSALRP